MRAHRLRWLALTFSLVTAAFAAEVSADRWQRFEPEFQAFAAADARETPKPGGILMVGSSIFRRWTDAPEMLAPLPVLNRAFGGSRTGDLLDRFEQLVPPYAPRIIVYYCGSNDLNAGEVTEDPAAIFARFRTFSERVRARAPETRMVFVSSTRSPDRVARWTHVDHYNALVRAYCAATPHHTFVDINPALVDSQGRPRLELYLSDLLHFHPPAYSEFAAVLKPVLTKLWAELSAEAGR